MDELLCELFEIFQFFKGKGKGSLKCFFFNVDGITVITCCSACLGIDMSRERKNEHMQQQVKTSEGGKGMLAVTHHDVSS